MRVKKVDYLEEYKIRVVFNDNKVKIVDLESELWGPMFESLKDLGYFKTVAVDQDHITIVWPNGVDFSPDVLYEMGKEVKGKKTQVNPTPARRKTRSPLRQTNRK